MIKENLRYNKIKKIIEDLNTREKEYLIKKLTQQVIDEKVNIVDFTINGKVVNG